MTPAPAARGNIILAVVAASTNASQLSLSWTSPSDHTVQRLYWRLAGSTTWTLFSYGAYPPAQVDRAWQGPASLVIGQSTFATGQAYEFKLEQDA